ncbi:hypothetical protein [Streptomyces roseoverticillatus]|uniref:hypothetical protein n=1 Tax=Streptomyces roseoverticillatus TaxID=66429 RepID=UPI0012FEADB9|nr:hypothetical protein [Streptomyces roseoverticillatus]
MSTSLNIAGWLGGEWGSVPLWIGTFLTSGSLIFAAATFWRSREDQKREHASKVGAWIGEVTLVEGGSPKHILNVSNTSDVGAYEIYVTDPNSRELLTYLSELPSKKTARIEVSRDGDTWKQKNRTIQLVRSGAGGFTVQLRVRDQPVEVEFRDALGRRWTINHERKITKPKGGAREDAPEFFQTLKRCDDDDDD